MKLMSVEEYRNTVYSNGSQPSRRTVIKYINEGIIPGKRLGKAYYIDIDADTSSTGNPLVDLVLQDAYTKAS